MAIERLDLKTARYDRFSGAVLIEGRGITVEVTREALEALARRPLNPSEAVARAVAESKRLTRLVMRLPPDDGKVHITTSILLGDGIYGETGEA